MKYRRLGSTEIEVSVIGLGTWQFGGEWGKDFTPGEAAKIIGEAKEQGINVIDTAECYGDHLSEEMVGEAIAGERDKWILATKYGHLFHDFLDRTMDFTPEGVVLQLEGSLKALKTDYIDLYQFHSGTNAEFDNDRLWELLAKEKEKGKIRHLGLSLSKGISIEDKIYQTENARRRGNETIQLIYNRLDRNPEETIFPLCRKEDLGILARVPLASGLLSGKYQPGHTFSGADVRAERDQGKLDMELRMVQEIRAQEVPDGVDMASWSLAWCLKQEAVTAVIPGCKSVEQVRRNARAVELL